MTRESWDLVSQIYERAIGMDEPSRASFLLKACGDDDLLLRELESLVASYELASTFIERPVFERGMGWFAEERRGLTTGSRLGNYEVSRVIGTGGMGSVYLALRADDQYRKQVAIKVIKRGMDTDFILGRFRHERQILANLNHPNIALLFDGGATEDGLPYYVMEYVEGEPVDLYCDSHRLSISERLNLFRIVCSAVQYAHQNLVVHLDIKPSNILVTAEGTPKLLDFGIAKLLNTGAHEQTMYAPGLAPRLITPGYGSPEQFRGEKVTTASDIYSLGVLLYEMLCGYRPYRTSSQSIDGMARAVCEDQPPRPSTTMGLAGEPPRGGAEAGRWARSPEQISQLRRTSPKRLRRELAGDLDKVVLKAMHKEPQRRYSSVEQFAEDLQRHLDGLPVTAQPDTLVYRGRKFVGRHKAGVLAGFLILASLVAGTVGTAWQAHVAREQRALAERRFSDVRALANSLLFDVHDAIKDLPGSTPARRLLVERALGYLDGLSREAGGDRSLRQELASAYEKVGDVQGNPYYANLGNTAGAIESYGKARAIRESLLAEDPANASLRWGLESNYMSLGWCSEAKQDFPDALRYLRQALTLAQGLTPPGPKASDRLAGANYAIANILAETGDPVGALESYRNAAAIRSSALAFATPAQSTSLRTHLAADYTGIGRVLAGQGRYEDAIEAQQQSTALLEHLSGADPINATLRVFLADSYQFLGLDLKGKGDVKRGVLNLQRAREVYQSLSSADPANAMIRYRLGYTDIGLADGLLKQNSPAESIERLGEAVLIFRQLTETNPSNNDNREGLVDAYAASGAGYEMLATKFAHLPSDRVQHWREARMNYERGLDTLRGSQQGRATSDRSTDEVAKLKENIARCDRAETKLRGGGRN